ncbi:hypothetical protein HBB16_05640 [Pseudonocardia sp. MCCB 268]|nr:hypothetical protein [Pseudonocardia cytotoxica]
MNERPTPARNGRHRRRFPALRGVVHCLLGARSKTLSGRIHASGSGRRRALQTVTARPNQDDVDHRGGVTDPHGRPRSRDRARCRSQDD